MSVDLLRTRLSEDIAKAVEQAVEIVIAGRQMPHEDTQYHRGRIAGLREAVALLDERYKNLHSIG